MAILRSPMAHARITRIDVSPALDRPGVVAAFSGARPRRQARLDAPASGRSPTTSRSRRTRRWRPTRCASSATPWRWSSPATATRPPTRSRRSRSTTSRCRRCSTCGPRSRRARPACTTDPGTNKCYTWKLAGGDYEAAKAKADRVFTRHYVNQRLIPMAMEPRAVVAAPDRCRTASSPCGRPPRSRTSCGCCWR